MKHYINFVVTAEVSAPLCDIAEIAARQVLEALHDHGGF